MRMSTRALYAVMALVDLALRQGERLVSLPEIAENQGISLSYLEQIFMVLRQKAFVKSLRGQKGGYVLARDPKDIHIAAIIEAMGEGPRATRCNRLEGSGRGCLPRGAQCLTHQMWAQLEAHIVQYLSGISLADICAHNRIASFSPPSLKKSVC